MIEPSSDSRQCEVCGHSPAADVCPTCGVDAARLDDVLAGPRLAIRSRKRGKLLTDASDEERASEMVWGLLSAEYRRALTEKFRTLMAGLNRMKALLLIPGALVALLTSFGLVLWATIALRWPENEELRWYIAAIAALVLAFFVSKVVAAAEDAAQRRAIGEPETGLSCAARIVLPALQKRALPPWPLRTTSWLTTNLVLVYTVWFGLIKCFLL